MSESGSDGRSGPARRLLRHARWSDAVALVAILVTAALGALAAEALPERLVVHWSLGDENLYWGLRTLPRTIALALGPAVAAATYGGMRGTGVLFADELAPVRNAYEALLVASVLGVCVAQVAVIVANLL